ncbi:CDP-glycerol glycerophosphotransferase family protein [Weissella paramesenteroides]|uniref:bifunctional glycosyltransferase/CDP-glycerol:glycerophosphate glycerophosphotransferase n=1 Tax=Weissella paramesenteroides TaxID=1249 RepID=UPI0038571AF0
MKVKNVTDKWLEMDSEGTVWIKPVESENYYLLGQTHNKKIKLETIDKCFEVNKLTKGKYEYYYVENGEKVSEKREILDADRVFSKIYSKGQNNQKSFFKPQNGNLMTYYPKSKKYKYKFSIIMAIYNVEDYIEEAILSVLNQSEKSVQLILVNDGTPDQSGKIARDYSNRFHNVIYLEQENMGVSAARNLGMTVAEGEFWNFMDPDDVISINTLKDVYNFFKPRKHITDVMTIPLFFFGDKNGEHPLNDKFKKGNRIINLLDADQSDIVLSLSTSFISMEAIENLELDTTLKVSEDLLLINTILLNKLTMGVISSARYNYRRINNTGAISKTQNEMTFEESKSRYTVYKRVIAESIRKYGMVVSFIQQVVIYDLSWPLKLESFVNDLQLTKKEKKILRDEYVYDIFANYIDLEFIYKSQRIPKFTKQELLYRRANKLNLPKVINRFGMWQANYKIVSTNDIVTTFIVANKHKNAITLIYQVDYPRILDKLLSSWKIELLINNKKFLPKSLENNNINVRKVLYENIVNSNILKFDIPLNNEDLILNKPVKLVMIAGELRTELHIKFNKHEFSSLGEGLEVDSISEKYVTKFENKHLVLSKKSEAEQKYLLKEAFGNDLGAESEYLLSKLNKRKPVWLFEDRPSMAGDNAEALFRYVTKNHKEIDSYFVLDKSSNDWDRLSRVGNVLSKFSEEHVKKWSISDVVISAHAEYSIFNPVARGENQNWRNYYKTRRILNKPPFVFLQHGILRSSHHASRWLNLTNKNIKLLVSTARYEEEEFSSEAYHYDKNVVKNTGMPRLDSLLINDTNTEKIILFMPTWRVSLKNCSDEEFTNSEYFKQINNFFNDERLLKMLRTEGYKIAFRIHPSLIKFAGLFDLPRNIYISNQPYSDLFKQSLIAVTDFSSAVLDFAYMKRPVIQYLFDQESFYSGHVIKKDREENEQAIYGEIYENDQYEEFIEDLFNKMKNPVMNVEFEKRIDEHFPNRDGKNSERLFGEIQKLIDDTK